LEKGVSNVIEIDSNTVKNAIMRMKTRKAERVVVRSYWK